MRPFLAAAFGVTALSIVTISCGEQLTPEQHIARAQEYVQTSEYRAAVIELKNALKQDANSPKARQMLGNIYLSVGDGASAQKELQRAMELGVSESEILAPLGQAMLLSGQHQPLLERVKVVDGMAVAERSKVHAVRAEALIILGDREKALTELKSAKAADDQQVVTRIAWARFEGIRGNEAELRSWLAPLLSGEAQHPDAWSLLAAVEQGKGELELAEEGYTKSIELRGYVHIDYLKRALLKVQRTDYDGAKEDLNKLKKGGVALAAVGYAEGLIAYQQQDFESAQGILDKVLGTFESYPPARLYLGLTNYQLQNYISAEKNLEIYLATNPRHYQASLIYSATKVKLKKFSAAAEHLERMRLSSPDDYRVVSMLGNAQILSGQRDVGIKTLHHATTLKPDEASVHMQLGAALMQQGDSVIGRQELLKAIELDPELQQAEMALYMGYMRDKDYAKAISMAENLLKKQPDEISPKNLYALALMADGQKDKAVLQLQNGLKKHPGEPSIANNLALIYLQGGDMEKAYTTYRGVLEHNPDHLKTLLQLSVLSARLNRPKEVEEWLLKAVESNPDARAPRLLLASQYLKQVKATEALQLLQGVSQAEQEHPSYQLLKAKAKMEVGEERHAIRSLKQVITTEPKLTAAHFLLSQAYAKVGDSDAMRGSLEQTLELQPNHFPAAIALTRLSFMQKRKDEGLQRLEELKKRFPDNPDVKLLDARVTAATADFVGASDKLKNLLVDSPHSEVMIELANNQWRAGQREEAITGLELWRKDNPKDTRALLSLAQFYMGMERFTASIEVYQKVNELEPNNGAVLNNLAWLLRDSDVEQGVKHARKAHAMAPKNPFIKDTLGMLLVRQGKADEAVGLLREALDAQPENGEIKFNLAEAYIKTGQTSLAAPLLDDLETRKLNQKAKDRIVELRKQM